MSQGRRRLKIIMLADLSPKQSKTRSLVMPKLSPKNPPIRPRRRLGVYE